MYPSHFCVLYVFYVGGPYVLYVFYVGGPYFMCVCACEFVHKVLVCDVSSISNVVWVEGLGALNICVCVVCVCVCACLSAWFMWASACAHSFCTCVCSAMLQVCACSMCVCMFILPCIGGLRWIWYMSFVGKVLFVAAFYCIWCIYTHTCT